MIKEIYILIGPASIGKTTYIKNTQFPGDYCIVSRDEVVARVSERYDLSFDELYLFPPKDSTPDSYISGFEKYGKVIESPSVISHLQPFSYEYLNDVNTEINIAFYNEFQSAIRKTNIKYIVVDRVHMRKKERLAYFNYLNQNRKKFVVTAVLFNFQNPDILNIIQTASQFRKKDMEKAGRYRTVSRQVQENMIKFYEEPSLDEGYDSLIKVDTIPALKDFIKSKYNEENFDQSGKCPYCDFEIISINPGCPDFEDKYRKHNYDTDICPSCKVEFIVEQAVETIDGIQPFTHYYTSKFPE